MRFMFFGPEVCLGLPSDSASPRTPLPPTTATAAFTAQDLHLVDNAHVGHTKHRRAEHSLRPPFFRTIYAFAKKRFRRSSPSPFVIMEIMTTSSRLVKKAQRKPGYPSGAIFITLV